MGLGYGITVILRFFYGFFSGYNKNTTQGRNFFFFFGYGFSCGYWGWVTDFVTHFLILIVKVHKTSRIYIQVSSYDYYTSFGFWKYYICIHVIKKNDIFVDSFEELR